MPRPIDALALYKVFIDELKKHPLPKEPGLARYRATVWLDAAGFFITMLMKAPTLNAVPVVRCKDCVYWKEAKTNSKGFLICPASRMKIMSTDFCSYGERRADNE